MTKEYLIKQINSILNHHLKSANDNFDVEYRIEVLNDILNLMKDKQTWSDCYDIILQYIKNIRVNIERVDLSDIKLIHICDIKIDELKSLL